MNIKKFFDDKKIFVFVILGILGLTVVSFSLLEKKGVKNPQSDVIPTEVVIPTVESSVRVDLIPEGEGREVVLKMEQAPKNTKTIDYELSYQTKEQGLQGVIGSINLNGEDSFEKRLTLGTCSAGTCIYHQVVGKIRLALRFSGDYGEKLFEKEYEI